MATVIKEAWIVTSPDVVELNHRPGFLTRYSTYCFHYGSSEEYHWTEREEHAKRYKTKAAAQRAADKVGGTVRLIRWKEDQP